MNRSWCASSICSRSVSARRDARRADFFCRWLFASSSRERARRARSSSHFVKLDPDAGRLAKRRVHRDAAARFDSAAAAFVVASLPARSKTSPSAASASPSATPSDPPASARARASASAARRKDSCERRACFPNSNMGLPSPQLPRHVMACHPRAASRHASPQKTSRHPPRARRHGVGPSRAVAPRGARRGSGETPGLNVRAAPLGLHRGGDQVAAGHAACGEREMAGRVVARGREAMRAGEETTPVRQRLHRSEGGIGDDRLALCGERGRDERGLAVARAALASHGAPPSPEPRRERRDVLRGVGGGGRARGLRSVVLARAFPPRRLRTRHRASRGDARRDAHLPRRVPPSGAGEPRRGVSRGERASRSRRVIITRTSCAFVFDTSSLC